jgi:hypothetical protein
MASSDGSSECSGRSMEEATVRKEMASAEKDSGPGVGAMAGVGIVPAKERDRQWSGSKGGSSDSPSSSSRRSNRWADSLRVTVACDSGDFHCC